MLKTRVLTVIVILPLFLLAVFYFQDIFWAALMLALTVVGAREWSKLAKFSVRNTIIFMFLTLLLGSELLIQLRESLKLDVYSLDFIAVYGISVLFWVIAVPFYLRNGFFCPITCCLDVSRMDCAIANLSCVVSITHYQSNIIIGNDECHLDF